MGVQAESEIEFNEWFSNLRNVCQRTEIDRTKRREPMTFVNTLVHLLLLSSLALLNFCLEDLIRSHLNECMNE